MSLKNSQLLLVLVVLLSTLCLPTKQEENFSHYFPLVSKPISSPLSKLSTNSVSNPYPYRSSLKYSMAMVVSLPIGTPPQTQHMVLDTGSQLSWIKCHKKVPPVIVKRPPPASFDPSLSSSFSLLPCNHPICKPRIPDFTLPTDCDQNRLCHYSYFYADGTLAEGNLVREKIRLSRSRSTPPLTLGCTRDASTDEGILGMNLGRLSFASQIKITKFSYCVPVKASEGAFYLGENPNSPSFRYVNLLTIRHGQQMPNFDPAAYTVGMIGININGKRLNISKTVFRPDASGAGQTMIDSGTEYTFLVDEAYDKVRKQVAHLVMGPKLKKGYVYEGALDLCYISNAMYIGRYVGDLILEFDGGVNMLVKRDRVFVDIDGSLACLSFGRSALLGVESNIIGNFHQQNHWVEFDISKRRIGFGEADCSKSI